MPDQFVVQEEGASTTLSGSEQLFSAKGSQRVIVGSAVQNKLKLKDLDDTFLLRMMGHRGSSIDWYEKVRSIGWYTLYPYYSIWDILWGDDTLIPISSVPRRYGIESIEDLWMWRLFITLKPNVVSSEKKLVKKALKPLVDDIWDYDNFDKLISNSVDMLDLIFSANTYMALFLCLFSLIASMSTNIVEQTKEIGILRSLGLTKFEINKVYVYEALVLILSSSLIGMMMGSVLSFVILEQQTLFTSYPVSFYVPQSIVGAVITGAVGTSVLSVWFPLKSLNKQQIAQNLRSSM